MTPQEAIRRVKEHNETHFEKEESRCTLISEALKMAIVALEKQIPKKPDYEGDGYDDNGSIVYDTAYCPYCRYEFEVYYDATEFCPACGQHLDWGNQKMG